MGLFTKKICGVCGSKLGLLDIMPIELTDGYLCKKCQDKCSPFLSFDLVDKKWSSEDVKNHYADLEGQKEKLTGEFTETDCILSSEFGNKEGRKLLSIDKNHGWFSVCGISEIYELSNVKGVTTSFMSTEYDDMDLHFKFEAPRPGMEVPDRGETLTSLSVEIILEGNPYTNRIWFNVSTSDKPMLELYPKYLERIYGTATQIYDFMKPYFTTNFS